MKFEDTEELKALIKGIEELFTNIGYDEKEIKDKIHEKNEIEVDLLHELELADLNAIEMMALAKRMKTNRKQRRIYKDQLRLIDVTRSYIKKFTEKGIIAESQQLLKNIETYESNLKTRKYEARVLKDLKCTK